MSRLSARRQGGIHLCLLGLALIALPITPAATWQPAPGDEPIGRILLVLLVSVGAPFLILSSTGPLLQGWFARLHPDRSPYRLYALSNAGSLLALISYPFVVEPLLRLRAQTVVWSAFFGLFALLCGTCAWRLLRGPAATTSSIGGEIPEPAASEPPRGVDIVRWVLLAACGSALLLATTNHMVLDVSAVPFLWVLPLSVYLLTFILCFESDRWYGRLVFCVLLPIALFNAVRIVDGGVDIGVVDQIIGYAVALFVCCMCCHGELARLKPAPRHLTLFFLMVALGGAVGGLFVAVVAPLVFDGLYEYHLLLVACYALILVVVGRNVLSNREPSPIRRHARAGVGAVACIGLVTLTAALVSQVLDVREDQLFRGRNFYGVLAIDEYAVGRVDHDWTLTHGRIMHGFQFRQRRAWPTSYYGPDSGLGFAIRRHPERGRPGRQFRIGVIGLGTGTVAAYGNARIDLDGPDYVWPVPRTPPDLVRFYEINPLVRAWADEHFTFLADARRRGADVGVYMGDARVVMQRQLEHANAQDFDVLAIDAFSGDAIPIHLLTMESLSMYWRHLKPDGILAIHVTNRFVDLVPVVVRLATELGKPVVYLENEDDEDRGVDSSDWMLMTSNRGLLEHDDVAANANEIPPPGPLWTDDFSSIFTLLK